MKDKEIMSIQYIIKCFSWRLLNLFSLSSFMRNHFTSVPFFHSSKTVKKILTPGLIQMMNFPTGGIPSTAVLACPIFTAFCTWKVLGEQIFNNPCTLIPVDLSHFQNFEMLMEKSGESCSQMKLLAVPYIWQCFSSLQRNIEFFLLPLYHFISLPSCK